MEQHSNTYQIKKDISYKNNLFANLETPTPKRNLKNCGTMRKNKKNINKTNSRNQGLILLNFWHLLQKQKQS